MISASKNSYRLQTTCGKKARIIAATLLIWANVICQEARKGWMVPILPAFMSSHHRSHRTKISPLQFGSHQVAAIQRCLQSNAPAVLSSQILCTPTHLSSCYRLLSYQSPWQFHHKIVRIFHHILLLKSVSLILTSYFFQQSTGLK